MYFSLLIEGAPFVGHDANHHNLHLKGRPFIMRFRQQPGSLLFALGSWHLTARDTNAFTNASCSTSFMIESREGFHPSVRARSPESAWLRVKLSAIGLNRRASSRDIVDGSPVHPSPRLIHSADSVILSLSL